MMISVCGYATIYIVDESDADFSVIQEAVNAVEAGDSIFVRDKGTPYYEKLSFPESGNAEQGFINLMAWPGEQPVIDGTDVSGANMILIRDRHYIRVAGFELRNNSGVSDGSGIRIIGACSHIELIDNSIHDMLGKNAMGITVYANRNDSTTAIVIDNNEIYDCQAAPSEALVLNGNVSGFRITNNIIRDVNNIGIDFIGGEDWISSNPEHVARNGVCSGNIVMNANSSYGGGYAGGIYVDGGKNIVIENNIVTGSDLGIEIGAENDDIVASGIIVRNNLVYRNEKVGIIFGGYASYTGRVKDCFFLNNTCYKNDILNEGWGELAIQYASGNVVKNNIFYSTDQNVMLYAGSSGTDNTVDYNLWYTEAGVQQAEFYWGGNFYAGIQGFRSGSGQAEQDLFADPLFVNTPENDFHVQNNSPAVDFCDPAFEPDENEVDMDGESRLQGGAVDAGADEVQVTHLDDSSVKELIPEKLYCLSAYPNPFNPAVTIEFKTPKFSDPVFLEIYNLRGRIVFSKKINIHSSGHHQYRWMGTTSHGIRVSSGTYLAQLRSADFSETIKVTLLR